jgi:general secretion pathway protein G
LKDFWTSDKVDIMPGFLAFNQNSKQKNSTGFTLIELLIAVSIIAILVAIGAASFLTAQKQSRDSLRKSDLGEVRAALEQFYGDNNRYPETDSGRVDCDGSTPLDWGDPFTCNGITYLNELPEDPTSGRSYFYEARDISDATGCSTTACLRFAIAADLENENDSDRDETNCDLPDPPGSTRDYCVLNP